MNNLYIYGTCFNNANRIKECLKSIAPLNPKRIFIVDNCSTDDSFRLLEASDKVFVIRKKCSRGAGRNISMGIAMKESKASDRFMYIDLDCIYNQAFIDYINKASQKLKPMELYCINYLYALSTYNTNIVLEWKNLQAGEDWERIAHAISSGIKVHNIIDEAGKYYKNEEVKGNGQMAREKRYAKGIGVYIRIFRWTRDVQRGEAYKSFKDFYEKQPHKNLITFAVQYFAYCMGNLMGVYSYDKKLNNIEYIKRVT
jgi:glycosyltransferase involved in cell wall biosynthesis